MESNFNFTISQNIASILGLLDFHVLTNIKLNPFGFFASIDISVKTLLTETMISTDSEAQSFYK